MTEQKTEQKTEHIDVLIVGAGISGVCAAYYIQKHCPQKSYAILEGREAMGGTWDLFRYPGIRSDSDMYTLGFSFRPWSDRKAIADGDTILTYLEETSKAYKIDGHIRYNERACKASWSSEDALWTVEVQRKGEDAPTRYTCQFLFMCSGYYNYEEGYTPVFPGLDDFKGEIVHPQKWTEDIDYEGKRVIVIGSGATAVTLVPALAEKATHVTMLQRSPTYIADRPAVDPIANFLRRFLPNKLAHNITRWKNILVGMYFFKISQSKPKQVRKFMVDQIKKALGPEFDVDTHFSPTYNPWDQRVCLVPDGDLFHTLKAGRASVVTDHIETFTPDGIQLKSGSTLEADLIVTATGLNLQFLGGMQLIIDGNEFVPSETMSYKGVMFSDVPNLALATGYTNASWTLKCELACGFVSRLLQHMDAKGYKQSTPRLKGDDVSEAPFLGLQSGYIDRSRHLSPKQGSKDPWKLHQNYIRDMIGLKYGKIDNPAMDFQK